LPVTVNVIWCTSELYKFLKVYPLQVLVNFNVKPLISVQLTLVGHKLSLIRHKLPSKSPDNGYRQEEEIRISNAKIKDTHNLFFNRSRRSAEWSAFLPLYLRSPSHGSVKAMLFFSHAQNMAYPSPASLLHFLNDTRYICSRVHILVGHLRFQRIPRIRRRHRLSKPPRRLAATP